MKKLIHIVTLGFEKDVVLESIKRCGYPIHKAILVIAKSITENQVFKNAEEVEKKLSVLIDVEKVYIDEEEVFSSAINILGIAKREIEDGNEVLINLSDSPSGLCAAGFIAAQILDCTLYKAKTNGSGALKPIEEIPRLPLKTINKDKIGLIKTIKENRGTVESIDKIIDLFEGRAADNKRYMAQRARMNYHLKSLESDGFLKMKRTGKNVMVTLTELGEAYALTIPDVQST